MTKRGELEAREEPINAKVRSGNRVNHETHESHENHRTASRRLAPPSCRVNFLPARNAPFTAAAVLPLQSFDVGRSMFNVGRSAQPHVRRSGIACGSDGVRRTQALRSGGPQKLRGGAH
jgi:hypothetical protein